MKFTKIIFGLLLITSTLALADEGDEVAKGKCWYYLYARDPMDLIATVDKQDSDSFDNLTDQECMNKGTFAVQNYIKVDAGGGRSAFKRSIVPSYVIIQIQRQNNTDFNKNNELLTDVKNNKCLEIKSTPVFSSKEGSFYDYYETKIGLKESCQKDLEKNSSAG